MTFATQRNIGALIKVLKGINPANSAAATITGPAIDRQGFESCVLQLACGAATGSPTARTVDAKLTHSDTSGGTYTPVNSTAVTQLTADNVESSKDIDLIGLKRYLKVEVVVAFTGGTTPAIPVAVDVILGGAVETPV